MTEQIIMTPSRWNTAAILATFVGTVFLGGAAYNKLQQGIDQASGFQIETKERLARLDTERANVRIENDKRLALMTDLMSKQSSLLDNQQYQIGQLQKGLEAQSDRIDRMSNANTDRWGEINDKLNTLQTNQALQNQSLQRIEDLQQRREQANSGNPPILGRKNQ